MELNSVPINSFQSQLSFDFKTSHTPQTAESIEQNVDFVQRKELTFSQFVSSADKNFLSEEKFNGQNGSFIGKYIEKDNQYSMNSMQKLLQKQQQTQTLLDCELVLKYQHGNQFEQIELTAKSLEQIKTIKSDQLSHTQLFDEIRIKFNQLLQNQNKTINLNEFIIGECFLDKDEIPKIADSTQVYIRVTGQLFERQLCCVEKKLLTQNCSQFIDFTASTFIKYDCENSSLKIIFPQRKVKEVKNLYNQLTNKSLLLNEVKSIKQLKGILFKLTQQNMGSRIIQKLIHLSPDQSIKYLKDQLSGKYDFLMMDKYGNYVVQKMFSYMENKQKEKFLNIIQKQIPQIVMTKFGTHCLQFILKKCHKSIQCMKIIQQAIKQDILTLSTNQFGTHFIQQLIILEKFRTLQSYLQQPENFISIANDKFGVLAIKRLMQKICPQYKMNQTKRQNFICLVYNNFNSLLIDEYGHFVIEQLAQYYSESELQWMLFFIVQNISFYGNNMFAYSVIRSFIDFYPNIWLSSITYHVFSSQKIVAELMNGQVGTFLLCKILKMVDIQTKSHLLKTIKKLINQVNGHERKKRWKKIITSSKQT